LKGTTSSAHNAQSFFLPVGKLSLFAPISEQRDNGTVAKHCLLFSPGADVPVNKQLGNWCRMNQGLKSFSGTALERLIWKNDLLASVWKMFFYLTVRKFDDGESIWMRCMYSLGFTIGVNNHTIWKSFFHVTVPKKNLKVISTQ